VKGGPLEGGRQCKKSSPEGWTHNGVAPDLSLPAADFTGEVDTRQCRFVVKVVVRFTLAGAACFRGRRRGAHSGIPIQEERDKEGEMGPVWARHMEKKTIGAPVMHMLEHLAGEGGANNSTRPMEAGSGRDRGGTLGSGTGRRKKRRMARAW
jgi:hypothetical protein